MGILVSAEYIYNVCRLLRTDDKIEIIRADDKIELAREIIDGPLEPFVIRDGPFIAIKGKTTFVCYEIVGENFERNTYYAHLIKKVGL